MTIFSKNLWGHGPFAPPGYTYARHVFLRVRGSLNFKPQTAYLFGTVVVYTCLQMRTFFAML